MLFELEASEAERDGKELPILLLEVAEPTVVLVRVAEDFKVGVVMVRPPGVCWTGGGDLTIGTGAALGPALFAVTGFTAGVTMPLVML